MKSRYDFSSPFMTAAIIRDPGNPATEERVDLSINSNPDNLNPINLTGTSGVDGGGGKLQLTSLSYLSSVTVSMDLGFVPTIDVVLTPTLEDGRKIIDSTLLEYALTAIEVQMGYTTGVGGRVSTPPFQGILGPPEIQFGADMTITLKGTGSAGYYGSTTVVARTLPKQSRLKHILFLASELPLMKINEQDWILDEAAATALQEAVDLPNAGKSHLHLISQLARQCGCWLRFGDANGFESVSLISQRKMLLQSPIAMLTLYDFTLGEVGPSVADRGIFPILSVSVASGGQEAIFLNGWTKNLRNAAVNKTTLETQTAEHKPQDLVTNGGRDGQVGVKGPFWDEGGGRVGTGEISNVIAPAPDSNETDQQQAISNEAAMLSTDNSVGLSLDIDTLGLPEVFPGLMFQVSGISTRIDGFYTCFGVKHSMSASGFQTSLSLKQNSQLMVQAIQDKITPKTPNESAPIPSSTGTNSDLSAIVDGVTVNAVQGEAVG